MEKVRRIYERRKRNQSIIDACNTRLDSEERANVRLSLLWTRKYTIDSQKALKKANFAEKVFSLLKSIGL